MRRIAWTAVALAVLAAAASCSKCGGPKDDPVATTQVEPPVPAPDGLLADISVVAPNGTWSKLQRGIGGPTGILPANIGGLIVTAFGIDPLFAGEIDGTSPAYAVVAGEPADPGWAVAVRLYDVRRARGMLADGDTAPYTAREDAGVTELVPKTVPSGFAQGALGVTRGGYLLIAKSSSDLARLGPYAARTLSARPLPTDGSAVIDVPRAAVEARLRPKLETAWAETKQFLLARDEASRSLHGGRAPDYADPKAIVSAIDALVGGRIAVFGDLERLRVAIDVREEGAFVLATMTPATADGPATKWIGGMRVGDAADVLAMPAVSALAMVTRDGDADREAQANEIEKTLTTSLGSRLAESDAKRLHAVVEDWTKARGETIGLALAWDEPRGVFLRGAVRDGDAASRAVKGLVELARVSPFKEALHVRDVATSTDDAPPLGKVSVATITREREAGLPQPKRVTRDGGAPAPSSKSMGLAWLVDGGAIDLSTGAEPVLTLRHGAKPERKLGDEPAVVKALAPFGNAASTIVVAQPLRFDPMRADLPVAPVVLGVGRKDKDGFVRIEIANGMLREVTRLLMTF